MDEIDPGSSVDKVEPSPGLRPSIMGAKMAMVSKALLFDISYFEIQRLIGQNLTDWIGIVSCLKQHK